MRRPPTDRFCSRCGQPFAEPEPQANAEPAAIAPPGGLAWEFRAGVLNNRYVWIRWAWATVWVGGLTALAICALIYGVTGGGDFGTVQVIGKAFLLIVAVMALLIVVLGLIAALFAGNHVTGIAVLDDEHAEVGTRETGVYAQAESIGLLFSSGRSDRSSVNSFASSVEAMLPGSGSAPWNKVRGVDVDSRRHVITLHRRWHHPLRLYVPADRFSEVEAYVRAHTTVAPPHPASTGRHQPA